MQSTVARLAHRDPVRPQARLLPSLNSGERCRDRTPRLVSTDHRPLGPAYAPIPFLLCPCRVFSLSGPDIFGSPGTPVVTRQISLPRRAKPLEIFGRPLNDVLFSREFRESQNYCRKLAEKQPRSRRLAKHTFRLFGHQCRL